MLTGYATFVSDPHFLTNDLLDEQAAEQVIFKINSGKLVTEIDHGASGDSRLEQCHMVKNILLVALL